MAGRAQKARKVFISYRRQAAHGHAQTLFRALSEVLGRRVFIDVCDECIPGGEDWRSAVSSAIQQADAVLLVIDPGLGVSLADPSGAVRFELETALEWGVRIVPIRVDGAGPFASDTLPRSLQSFADVNAPAVRPDTSVSDVNRIVKEITGHSPGEVRVADRWDAVAVATIVGIGALAWVSWGQNIFGVRATWIWASAILFPVFVWWFGRRALRFPAATTGKSVGGYVATRGLAVLALAGVWALLAGFGFSVPVFPEDGGILVARFDRDPADEFQARLTRALRNEGAEIDLAVEALPLWLDPDSEDGARKYGSRSGASVVLWGSASAPAQDVISSAVHVLFLNRPGLFQRAQGPTRTVEGTGRLLGPEGLALSFDLAVLERVLPRLLAGYQLYVEAPTSPSIAPFFDQALSEFEDFDPDDSRSTALEDVLATLHFLRGNVRFLAGQSDSAEVDYLESIEHSSATVGPERPLYIEPLNNLALIHFQRRQFDSALSYLRRSDGTCRTDNPPSACAHVAYHEGVAFLELEDHEKADVALENAIAISAGTSFEPDHRLTAYAYHNRAFSAVRQAAKSIDHDRSPELLARADREEALAVRAMANAGLVPPITWQITVARVAIERGQWQGALDALRRVMQEMPDESDPYALAAAVMKCLNDGDAAESGAEAANLLSTYTALVSSIPNPPGFSEYSRITAMCA